MKRMFVALLFAALFTTSAFAQTQLEVDPNEGVGGGGIPASGPANITDHHGGTMQYAKVVYLFWGSFPSAYVSELQAFRDSWGGMTEQMWMLAQYNAAQSSLTSTVQADVLDPSSPGIDVTDSAIRQKVTATFGTRDFNTIYLVFLPPGSYGDLNGSHSCGGNNLRFCAYHHSYTDPVTAKAVKYGVIPYPSCSGCQVNAGGVWANDAQNAEVSVIHETREAMTDPVPWTGWFEGGNEADDKCAPAVSMSNVFYLRTPGGPMDTPYYSPGHTFFFQKEWSNAEHGCVQ
jgi:hypothetical protein